MPTRNYIRANKYRAFANWVKVGCGCNRCGYNANPAALEFDHIDRQTKEFNVGGMMYSSFDKITKEMQKCNVLCANCHKIKSVEEHKEYYKTIRV